MNVGVLFSGGKDSTLALHLAKEYGLKVKCLLSMLPKTQESYMFHYPNINFVDMQAKAMEIPLLKRETEGKKEKELEDLKKLLNEAKRIYNIEGIVTGAVKSTYQASRIQKICNEMNLEVFNPLWLKDENEIFNMLKERNFEVIITGVYAYPLDESFLGNNLIKEYERLTKIKSSIDISIIGEGGEIETFVLDAPLFKKKIKIIEHKIHYKNNQGTFIIKKVQLVSK